MLGSTEEAAMSIGAISSSYTSSNTQAILRQPEATEAKTSPKDNDSDSDAGPQAIKTAASTVNLNGQTVGQLVNAVA